MRNRGVIRFLCYSIALLACLAAGLGVFSRGGSGAYEHESVRGRTVVMWGRGLYRDMSAEVAPQGIAQDVVTLFVAIPVLLGALRAVDRGSRRARFVLAGTLSYFLVTYLFYLMMAAYNAMFLAYVLLLSASFFALALVLFGFDVKTLPQWFVEGAPVRSVGAFLMINAVVIALLWLGVVVPPLLDGTVVPPAVEHYTTLVVQGLDLALLLPLSFLAGYLLRRRASLGFLLAPTYVVFLTLLMTALTAKIVAMGLLGSEIMPAIVIIPTLNVVSAILAFRMVRSVASEG